MITPTNYAYLKLRTWLAEQVADILNVPVAEVVVEDPADERVGADMAVPCFKYAREWRQAPAQIAGELASTLAARVASAGAAAAPAALEGAAITASGPYVNVQLAAPSFARQLAIDVEAADVYGFTDEGAGRTVVVDMVGLNLAKPFSVGHLRPTVQGAALVNLHRALGYQVIGDNHLGDWGTPFGMWVVAFKRWGSDEALRQGGVYELGRLYVKFRQEAKIDSALLDEAKAWLKKLEAHDAETVELQERFTKISLDHMNVVLGRLGVCPDESIGESFYISRAPELVRDLLERGIATEGTDGSVIVDLSDYGIETPILLRKSDGSFLYATTDILTVMYRVERWHPAKIIYSVGGEQQLHLKQIFALADKLGCEVELTHPWFGTVDELDEDGHRGKMSSRKGISLLEQLLDAAEVKAREVFPDGSETDIRRIAVGAIKFSDFAQSRHIGILFDWDTMFSLNGFSGPYAQYAAVRVRSLLRKAGAAANNAAPPTATDAYDWQAERRLIAAAVRYPAVIQAAAAANDLHPLARYCYELAQEFNHYYEQAPILSAEEDIRAHRLWLVSLVGEIIESALGILGIEIPSHM